MYREHGNWESLQAKIIPVILEHHVPQGRKDNLFMIIHTSDDYIDAYKDAREFIETYREKHPIAIESLFSGSRWTCVSDVVTAYNPTDNTTPVALATLSRTGEMETGQPELLSMFVAKDYRKMGLGQRVMETAIRLAIEKYLPTSRATTIRIVGLSQAISVMVNRLPKIMRHLVDFHDMSQQIAEHPHLAFDLER